MNENRLEQSEVMGGHARVFFIHKFSPNLNNQASSFPLQILS